ncbi:MAG: TetR/AcrR family transcriptional regulator [Solirubrobacteraceae bacterium]
MPVPPNANPRPLRADAQRNRARLLEVALHAFSAEGSQPVPLEAIAREAGVGIGTLYRHFPTREALAEATYRNELARLCDGVAELLAHLPADQAMRVWRDRFFAYMETKRELREALQAVIAAGANPFAESRGRLVTAMTTLLTAGVKQGTLRDDVSADDVLAAMSGIAQATAGAPEQRDRLLDLLLDGLRRQPHGESGPPAALGQRQRRSVSGA